jgi:hypothetical protein
MGPNRSLDEFLGGAASDEDPEPDDGAGADGTDGGATGGDAAGGPAAASEDAADEQTTTSDDAPAAEPVTSTYRWDPDGAACAACGSRVQTRWRDDDRWVCPACKAW